MVSHFKTWKVRKDTNMYMHAHAHRMHTWTYNKTAHNTHVCCKCGVGVFQPTRHLVLLNCCLHLTYQANNRVVLLICFSQRCLELAMCIDQALYFLHGVDNEHVYKVLPCAIQPVVEWLSISTTLVTIQYSWKNAMDSSKLSSITCSSQIMKCSANYAFLNAPNCHHHSIKYISLTFQAFQIVHEHI